MVNFISKRTRFHWLQLTSFIFASSFTSLSCRPAAEHQTQQPDLGATQEIIPEADEFTDPEFSQEEAELQKPASKPVHSREEAFTALASGDSQAALAFLQTWLNEHPKDDDAHVAASYAALHSGDYAAAQALLAEQRAPSEEHKKTLLFLQLRLLQIQGDIVGAIALLEKKLQVEPNSLIAKGELLYLLRKTEQTETDKAKQLMDELYDAYDAGQATSVDDLVAVAQAALARGSSAAFHDANQVLEEAEQKIAKNAIDPRVLVSYDRILLLRGAVFGEKYAAQEALTSYALILERDPWHADVLAGAARVLLTELQLAKAAQYAQKALQSNPNQLDAHSILAQIALIEGRRAEAEEIVTKQILPISPHHPGGLAVLAGLAFVREDRSAYPQLRDRMASVPAFVSDFFLDLGELLALMHMYPEADEVLTEAVQRAPKNPYLQSAFGLNRLRLGDEARGREALAQAWKRDRFNARTANVLDLFEQRIDSQYSQLQSSEFELRMPSEDQDYIRPEILDAAVRARKALNQHYRLNPGMLRLEIFANPEDFSIRTIGVPSLGAVGVCFGKVITMVGNHGGTHNLYQVIWHELAHVYALQLSRGRVPRWFTEGLSEWETELADPAWARESSELLLKAKRSGQLRRLSELELAFLRAESPLRMEVAYMTAAYAVRYLGTTYGREQLIDMLKGYGQGKTTEEVFKHYLGKDIASVESAFETWLDDELKRKIHGWEPTKATKDKRNQLYQQAIHQVKNKHLQDAARTLQSLIQAGGDGYSTRMLLARVLWEGPSWSSAKSHLERAASFQQEAIDPLRMQVELAERSKDVKASKDHLSTILAIDSMSFEPAARLTVLAMVTDDRTTFLYALERATAIAPLHSLTLAANAWRLAEQKNDRPRAQALLARALQSLGEKPHVDTLVMVAIASEALGDGVGARAFAERAKANKNLDELSQRRLAKIINP